MTAKPFLIMNYEPTNEARAEEKRSILIMKYEL